MSRPLYWSLLGACVGLSTIYTAPALEVLNSAGAPPAWTAGKVPSRAAVAELEPTSLVEEGGEAQGVESLAAVQARN